MGKKLTQRQREVLAFVKNYIREKGYSPSYHDISRFMGFSPPASKDHVYALVRKGHLEHLSGLPRSLKIPKQFLLHVTENVEVCPKTPQIRFGDYLTIRETAAANAGDIVISGQDPIVVKLYETGDSVFGKVVGFSRPIKAHTC